MGKIDVIVEHVQSLQDGRCDAALELCLAFKTSGTIAYEPTRNTSFARSSYAALHRKILTLLGLCSTERGPYDKFSPHHCPLEIDLAAIIRRIRVSMEEHGCEDLEIKLDVFQRPANNGDCRCHRRASLELLHFLQLAAWSQICAKVYMTLGRIVSAELCEMLWLYTMAAEEIPLDPRVTLPGREVRYASCFMRPRAYQHFFKDEYRCPKYKGFVGDRGRRVAEPVVEDAEEEAQSGANNVGSMDSAVPTVPF